MKKIGGSFPYIALSDKPNGHLEQLTPEAGELKYFMSGRCGIYYALLDHKLTTDKLVAYVPLYTCETVLAPFHKAGYELVFYDFDENGKGKTWEIRDAVIKGHPDAVRAVMDKFTEFNVIEKVDDIKGVGHRIVQGGEYFSKAEVVTDYVSEKVLELAEKLAK